MFNRLTDEQIAKGIKATIALIVIVLLWIGVSFIYNSYFTKNKVDIVLEKAVKNVNENPGDIQARVALADMFEAKSRTEEAIAQYNEALKLNKKYGPALFGLGVAYLKSNNEKQALFTFDKEIKVASLGSNALLDSYLEQAFFYKGKILFERKSYKEAAKNFEGALKIAPLMSDSYFFLGKCFQAMGKKKEAANQYKKAVELNPQSEAKEALKNIGY